MRVIAGSARRLQLVAPKGDNTRPTTDKIKETLFNILNFDLYDSNFLDLFAGSGGIGIEALSRGASFCTFVEKDKEAIACIQENLKTTKFENKSTLIASDIIFALRKLSNSKINKFDFVFMDPPYNKNLEKEVLLYLRDANFISDTTEIIIEMSEETKIDWIEDMDFDILKIKEYKTNKHIFLRRK